jgi:hypothetical protein
MIVISFFGRLREEFCGRGFGVLVFEQVAKGSFAL